MKKLFNNLAECTPAIAVVLFIVVIKVFRTVDVRHDVEVMALSVTMLVVIALYAGYFYLNKKLFKSSLQSEKVYAHDLKFGIFLYFLILVLFIVSLSKVSETVINAIVIFNAFFYVMYLVIGAHIVSEDKLRTDKEKRDELENIKNNLSKSHLELLHLSSRWVEKELCGFVGTEVEVKLRMAFLLHIRDVYLMRLDEVSMFLEDQLKRQLTVSEYEIHRGFDEIFINFHMYLIAEYNSIHNTKNAFLTSNLKLYEKKINEFADSLEEFINKIKKELKND